MNSADIRQTKKNGQRNFGKPTKGPTVADRREAREAGGVGFLKNVPELKCQRFLNNVLELG